MHDVRSITMVLATENYCDALEVRKLPHILVVEDERHVARLIEYFLAKAGYSVLTTDSCEKALELAKEKIPDALILDLILPGMSGLDFLKVLRQDDELKAAKVIVLSAHWFASDDPTLTEAGANAHCTKPVSPAALVRVLTDLGVSPPKA